jgi:hypothetical protein
VAFANSVPEGGKAILFIGVANDGRLTGLDNPDKVQKMIRQVAEKDCYPPVRCQTMVFAKDGKDVLGVIVEASQERPHFSGPAYVRRGSESVAASGEVYEDLIASRNTKAGRILRSKGQLVIIRQMYTQHSYGRQKENWKVECRIEDCDAHVIDLHDIGSGRHFSEPLDKIRISKDHTKMRMMIDIIEE